MIRARKTWIGIGVAACLSLASSAAAFPAKATTAAGRQVSAGACLAFMRYVCTNSVSGVATLDNPFPIYVRTLADAGCIIGSYNPDLFVGSFIGDASVMKSTLGRDYPVDDLLCSEVPDGMDPIPAPGDVYRDSRARVLSLSVSLRRRRTVLKIPVKVAIDGKTILRRVATVTISNFRPAVTRTIWSTDFDNYVNVCINGSHQLYASGGRLYCEIYTPSRASISARMSKK